MYYAQRLKHLVRDVTGFHVYRTPPRGMSIFSDVRKDLPKLDVKTVFDVGANVGQSAKAFLSRFPSANIHCFEPIGSIFKELQSTFENNARVTTHQTALGASSGTALMS